MASYDLEMVSPGYAPTVIAASTPPARAPAVSDTRGGIFLA